MDVENYQLAFEQEKQNTKEYISNMTGIGLFLMI